MSDAQAFERCIAAGGVAVFPADTVYGLACDPEHEDAVRRLCELKRRDPGKPSAVMFFDLPAAQAALDSVGERTRRALARLLPGAVSVVLPNPVGRFPLACGQDPGSLGVRVPVVPALAGVRRPVLQSSANFAGGPDPVRLADVPEEIRRAADLVLDGGELPGTPSTVIDLRDYEAAGEWRVLRAGALPVAAVAGALDWDPEAYGEEIRADIPDYERLQAEVAAAAGAAGEVRRILELGTGTGETARRLLERHPGAELVGVDASAAMLAAARAALPAGRVRLACARLEDPLPPGPFDLAVSALCVHHLAGAAKAELFTRVAGVLGPGARFVLGDVVVPEDPAHARTPLTDGYDFPSRVDEQLDWLRGAGFQARVGWAQGDLAVIVADRPATGDRPGPLVSSAQ